MARKNAQIWPRDLSYDTETGFYYLQSRYYDPEICRFVNADAKNRLEENLMRYCGTLAKWVVSKIPAKYHKLTGIICAVFLVSLFAYLIIIRVID